MTLTPTRQIPASAIATLEVASVNPDVSPSGSTTIAPGAAELTLSPRSTSVAYALSPGPAELSFDAGEPIPQSSVWILGGKLVEEIVKETRSWDTLTLTFRAGKQQVIDHFRPLDQETGKLDILEKADGGYIAVDRADGSNTYQVTPPTGRQPPRLAGTCLVNEYSEETVDQQGKEYKVTLTFVPESPRATDSGFAETAGSGEWQFGFETGAIATRRVNAGVGSSASSGTRDKRLQLILTDEQVQVLEESVTRLNAVRVREVPDGENLAEDNSTDGWNTVSVASPDEDVFDSGDYVIQSWETTMQNDDWHRVSVTVKSK